MGGKPDAFFQHASAQCKVGGGIGGVIVCPPNKLVEWSSRAIGAHGRGLSATLRPSPATPPVYALNGACGQTYRYRTIMKIGNPTCWV